MICRRHNSTSLGGIGFRLLAGLALVAPLPKNVSIVTYCAIGYRSARAARELRAAGYTHVRNLEGAIFQWANEHRSLIHDGKRVTRVHPYSAFWGRLLEPEARAPLP